MRPAETAASILAAQGCACRNFSFKTGSPPNYYALVRLFQEYRIRPKALVLEVNQKALNEADPAYRKLHPTLATLAAPLLGGGDRAMLEPPPQPGPFERWLDQTLSPMWLLYAMRADIRTTLYGDPDAVTVQHPTPDLYEGTYDLTPLTEKNVGVHFLEETVDYARAAGVPVIAFMTPTNHVLLHEFIDSPQYRKNGLFLRGLLEKRGARVLDLDTAFRADEFFDNAHLRPPAQRRLAAIIARALARISHSGIAFDPQRVRFQK